VSHGFTIPKNRFNQSSTGLSVTSVCQSILRADLVMVNSNSHAKIAEQRSMRQDGIRRGSFQSTKTQIFPIFLSADLIILKALLTGWLAMGPSGWVLKAHASPFGGAWAFSIEPSGRRGTMMDSARLFERYRELQSYVGWVEADARRIAEAAPLLEPYLHELIDDFYAEIERHSGARKVITGGTAQIERLKGTLVQWIRDLLAGSYDESYVARRWRVGWRHVEIGLEQVYTNVALSRLRTGLVRALQANWQGDLVLLRDTVRALDKLLDLDLAIIEDAYQAEYASRLQRTERLATLGQVAGGVAHELRNPLNVVKTSVYYLLNARNPTPEKKEEHLRRIERNVELADGVITALSNFARMPVPDLIPIPVEPLVLEVLEINPPGSRIEVSVQCPPGLPFALGDAAQLRIALGNLVRNARDAMPQGGRLTIEAQAREGRVEISVADTGVGIDKSDLARIMEPLYSTKARGLGLGLAIARSIIERNQGIIQVVSEPGRGSVFTVRLRSAPNEGAAAP
jgi:two-component system, NtrC family, sensor kinase